MFIAINQSRGKDFNISSSCVALFTISEITFLVLSLLAFVKVLPFPLGAKVAMLSVAFLLCVIDGVQSCRAPVVPVKPEEVSCNVITQHGKSYVQCDGLDFLVHEDANVTPAYGEFLFVKSGSDVFLKCGSEFASHVLCTIHERRVRLEISNGSIFYSPEGTFKIEKNSLIPETITLAEDHLHFRGLKFSIHDQSHRKFKPQSFYFYKDGSDIWMCRHGFFSKDPNLCIMELRKFFLPWSHFVFWGKDNKYYKIAANSKGLKLIPVSR